MRNSESRNSMLDSVETMSIAGPDIDVLNNTKIGKGTYGFVEKGKLKTSSGDWIPVAIKYMHDKDDIQHLVREARTMFQLKGHPHCVQVFGLFACPRHGVGAVMEFMDCKSLADLILKKNIAYTMDHFVSWMYQLASAVDYFHSQNLLHRDLKLQNLLLSDRYRVLKVGDFGTFTPQRDSMKSLRGTPVTMAPEIFKSERYNKKCDIYSIGIIMWQLIARREPYAISDANALLWNVAAAGKRPPELTCHRLLSDFYKRCWNEVPADRPESSEVLGYFEVLKKVYPKGDEPLIDELTQEPARTPQPQNVVLSPSLRGHRRTGSDQSTLTFSSKDICISGTASANNEDDLRGARYNSVARQNPLNPLIQPGSNSTKTVAPIQKLASSSIIDCIDKNLRPPPPIEYDNKSNQIYNDHVLYCHRLCEVDEILQRELRIKHTSQLQLKHLLLAKTLEEEHKRLETIKDDAYIKIQKHS